MSAMFACNQSIAHHYSLQAAHFRLWSRRIEPLQSRVATGPYLLTTTKDHLPDSRSKTWSVNLCYCVRPAGISQLASCMAWLCLRSMTWRSALRVAPSAAEISASSRIGFGPGWSPGSLVSALCAFAVHGEMWPSWRAVAAPKGLRVPNAVAWPCRSSSQRKAPVLPKDLALCSTSTNW